MKKNKKTYIGILIILLLVFCGFFYVKNKRSVLPQSEGSGLAKKSIVSLKETDTGSASVSNNNTLAMLSATSTAAEQKSAVETVSLGNEISPTISESYLYVAEHTFSNEQHRWSSIASSADGTKLVAVSGMSNLDDGYVYTSTDGGNTWTQRFGGVGYWFTNVASSADGATLAVATDFFAGTNPSADGDTTCESPGCTIYVSNDSGVTWNKKTRESSHFLGKISMSADGKEIMVALFDTPHILLSTDGGDTFTEKNVMGLSSLSSIAVSGDGKHIAVASTGSSGKGGYISVSNDMGNTWIKLVGAGSHLWGGVTLSYNGLKFSAYSLNTGAWHSDPYGSDTTWPGNIFTSEDQGNTWTKQIGAGTRYWSGLASSADGKKLIASALAGDLYVSVDGGVTWSDKKFSNNLYWSGVTMSADGTKFGAVNTGPNNSSRGTIWTN